MTKGIVFNIQRYSVHDGPGIRTVIFLKGCPLSCKWCSNPESQDMKPSFSFNKNTCISCGNCLKSCTQGVVSFDKYPKFDLTKCNLCRRCEENCAGNSIKFFCSTMSCDEVIDEVLKDKLFYQRSGGGLTLSGGEPLMQPEFVKEILQKANELNISTNVETCGFTSREIIEEVLSLSDLVYCDLKHMNSTKHKEITGQGNEIILDNIKFMVEKGFDVVVRIPLIPGFNNDKENLENTAEFLKGIKGLKRIGLLPYHDYGKGKYEILNKEYLVKAEKLSDEEIEEARQILLKSGHKVEVGN